MAEHINILLLCKYYNNRLFNQILDIFGHELCMQFIRIFGGITVEIPSMEQLENFSKELRIYNDYKKGIKLSTLATKHGVTSSKILFIDKKIGKLIDEAQNINQKKRKDN